MDTTTTNKNNDVIYNDKLFKSYYKNMLMRAIRAGRKELEEAYIDAPDFPVKVCRVYRNENQAANTNSEVSLISTK